MFPEFGKPQPIDKSVVGKLIVVVVLIAFKYPMSILQVIPCF